MKLFAWMIAAFAAIAFAGSFLAETRLAPLVGAILLAASIAYATWINQTSSRANLLRAERATMRQRQERASK